MSMKNSNFTSWDRTRALRICSTAPYPLCYLCPALLCVTERYIYDTNTQAFIVFDVSRESSNSETWATIYQSALRNVPQEFVLHQYRSENFNSHIMRVSLKVYLVVSELWARKSKNPSQILITGHRAELSALSS